MSTLPPPSSTRTALERLIDVLRIDKRRSTKLSHFGAAIYMELFRFSREHPHLNITKDSHFADYANIDPVIFSRFLTGIRTPDPELTEHICNKLECSFDRKIEIMSLIQQTPLIVRKVAEQKLQRDLLPFVSALERQPTASALSLATETKLPAIKEIGPVLEDIYLKEMKVITPTTEPLASVASSGGQEQVPMLRGARLPDIDFPRRRSRPTSVDI